MKIQELLQEVEKVERNSLLAGIIANLVKKGEKVSAYADVWAKGSATTGPMAGKKRRAGLYPVTKVESYRLHLQVGEHVYTWFELYGMDDDTEAGDEQMYFQKEGDTWVLAEKGRKAIIA